MLCDRNCLKQLWHQKLKIHEPITLCAQNDHSN